MCGIFGYIGKKNPVKLAIDGLHRLEYRGYDSAGIAGVKNGKILVCKDEGNVAKLEKMVIEEKLELDIVIAHTRWATHGKPNRVNAHPHFDAEKTLCLVHNGIIENHAELRAMLKEKGIHFVSETDTEVIVQLISHLYKGDLLEAVERAIPLLRGSYAVALIHKDYPDKIVAFTHECPLVIGVGAHEAMVSSDPKAFASHTRKVIYLSSGEIAFVGADSYEIFDPSMEPIFREPITISAEETDVSKGEFEHYTLKEIYEQPRSIRAALLSRLVEKSGTAIFDELEGQEELFRDVSRILIVACGTSWHAGFAAAYMIEDLVRVPVQVEISSEFRYKNPIVQEGTLAIAISQSGETADTIAAIRELKEKGAKILAICNVMASTITREADCTLYLRAGPEIGVASTKAFTSQMVVLSLFALYLARMRNMSRQEGQELIHALSALPEQVQRVLDHAPDIEAIAIRYARYNNFFFLGRREMYPAALEGALKLKEISYVNANGYPAGEMKHGPIALIDAECPTVALCANRLTYEKMLSNLMEVKARDGQVIAIAEEGQQGLDGVADAVVRIPKTLDPLAIIPATVVTQLFAYFVARERGATIDQPRNLAKSVTVE